MTVIRFAEAVAEHEYNQRDVWQQAKDRGGLIVVVDSNDHLQLDFDRPITTQDDEVFELFKKMTELVIDHLDTRSQNGNTHRYIRLSKPVYQKDRLLLQAALGSDGKREIISLCRIPSGLEPIGCLFETPEEYIRVKKYLGLKDEQPQENY